MDFKQLISERYSVRAFKDTPVEKEKLSTILEAARVAPTAHNAQPQRVKIITDKAGLELVDKCTSCRFGASTVLLICYDETICRERVYDGAKSCEVDVAIVTTHMVLQAWELGIGSCWVMNFDPQKVRENFNLPKNFIPVAFLPLGYASAAPSPRHTDRKPIEELLF